jgi:hypothetical protein
MTEKVTTEHRKHVLRFTIDGKHYDSHQEYITGAELKKLGKIHAEDDILLVIKQPWENQVITNDEKVNLARPGMEHFISKENPVKMSFIVNGREKQWDKRKISFEEVVVLALGAWDSNPNRVVTVTYDRGSHENPEGSMLRGDIVFVKNKMIFNVTSTDKS